jgi:hypothetical protein
MLFIICREFGSGHDSPTGIPVRSHHLSGLPGGTAVKGELHHHQVLLQPRCGSLSICISLMDCGSHRDQVDVPLVSGRIHPCWQLCFVLRWFPTQCRPLLVLPVWTITIRVFAVTRSGIMSPSVVWIAVTRCWRSFVNTNEDRAQRIRRSARGAALEFGFLSKRRHVGLGCGDQLPPSCGAQGPPDDSGFEESQLVVLDRL